MEDDPRRLIITLNRKDHKSLKFLSVEQDKSMNFLINQALREFMVKHVRDEETAFAENNKNR